MELHTLISTHPGNPSGRIAALDGLRGIAVLGILLMNIISYGLPEGAYVNPAAYGARGPADYLVWGVTSVLVDGRMRALFSMLFGASMLLVAQRAKAAGEGPAEVHYYRIVWLGMFGAAHLYLLWRGDILLHYALVGSVAFLFVGRPTPALLRLALLCFVIQCVIASLAVFDLALLRTAAVAPGAPDDAVRLWNATQSVIGRPTPPALTAEVALYRGNWFGIVRHMAADQTFAPLTLLLMSGAETLGLMLLGMAGLQSGFLTGVWTRATYRRAALWAYGVGVPLGLTLVLVDAGSGFDSLTVFGCWMVGSLPLRPLVAAGHAAVALLWLSRGEGGLRPWVVAAGRTAFSNYLGASLLMTGVCYGWGLGLFGHLSRAELYLFVPPVWIVMLSWSRAWLNRFGFGPLEWLWRCLSRRRWQPLQITIARQSQ